MPQYKVSNFCKVDITDQNRCSGTARRFKGSLRGRYNPAICPICKIPADYLGMAGVTSDLVSSQRVVVPEHADYRKMSNAPQPS